MNKKLIFGVSFVGLLGWFFLSGESKTEESIKQEPKQEIVANSVLKSNQSQYKKDFLDVVNGLNNNFYRFNGTGYENNYNENNFIINGVLYNLVEENVKNNEKSIKVMVLNPSNCENGKISLFFAPNSPLIDLTCVDNEEKWSLIDFDKSENDLIKVFYNKKLSIKQYDADRFKNVDGQFIFSDENNEKILKNRFVIDDSIKKQLILSNKLYLLIKDYLEKGQKVEIAWDFSLEDLDNKFEFNLIEKNIKIKLKKVKVNSFYINVGTSLGGFVEKPIYHQYVYVEFPQDEKGNVLTQNVEFYNYEINSLIKDFLNKQEKINLEKSINELDKIIENKKEKQNQELDKFIEELEKRIGEKINLNSNKS